MKSFNHFLRSVLLFTVLVLTVCSCDMFNTSVNQYLSKYTEQIVTGDIKPCDSFTSRIDNNGNLCIPSNLDEDYCFDFNFVDPQDRPNIALFYEPAPEDEQMFPEHSDSEGFYCQELDKAHSYCKISFKTSYLKEKDKETSDRNIKLKLFFKYSYTGSFEGDGIKNDPFYLNCVVNTPPEILEDNYKYCKLIVGGVKRNILCFNIKPEEENLYGDLKNSNGNYTIRINGTPYEFYFDTTTHKPVFQGTDKFYSSLSSIPNSSGLETPEGGFEEKTNPVYFVTDENTAKIYDFYIVDNHGLDMLYQISTAPSGKQKLTFNESKGTDYLQITPNFQAVPQKEGETPITVNNLTLVYKVNDGVEQEHSFNDTTPFKIYVPGGETKINYYMKTTQEDINQSEHKEENFTLQNKIYVTPSPGNTDCKGGTNETPWNIKDALEYLGHQTGEWTLDVGSGEYKANSEEDITTEDNVNAFLYVKRRDNQESLKINIEGKSNTQRATFNANGNGRVFYPNGVQIYLKNVNITGGVANAEVGGGITANAALSLENCDVYGNQAKIGKDVEGHDIGGHGGGIYKAYEPLLYIKNCKIYSNQAEDEGGGICMGGKSNHKTNVHIEGTQIYGNTAGTNGGGIYNTYGKAFVESTQIYSNKANVGAGIFNRYDEIYLYGGSIIGTASNDTAQYTENSGKYSNRAAANGGGIYSSFGTINIGYYLDEEQELTGDNDDTNSIVYNSASSGGGIYCNQATINVYNGIIDCNYASNNGGGVYLYEKSDGDISKFHIQTSLMRKNEADSTGGAIYIGGKNKTEFIPMGTVSIESDAIKKNDVYLKVKEIAIKLNSTPGLNSSSKITITPADYTDNTKKITGIDDAVIAQKYKCFSITKNGNTKYFLTPEAKLTEYQPAETLTSDPSSSDKIGAFSPADINNIAALVENGTSDFSGVTITLQEDLTLNRTNYTSMGTRTNTVNHPFKGTFDGNGKTITFTECNKPLFNYTNGATIKNINITGTFTGVEDTYLGPIIQIMYGGTLQNCKSTCNITVSSGNTVGGFVALAYGSEESNGKYSRGCLIDGCINEGSIDAPNTPYAGGIAGSAKVCEIRNCAQKNYVKGKTYVGGIAARIDGKGLDGKGTIIENSYVRGNITATEGMVISSKLTCYAGGIAGYYTYTDSDQTPTIKNIYFWGTINIPTANGTNNLQRGAILGVTCNDTYHPNLYDCYYKASDYYFECGSYSLENGEVHRVDGDVSFYLNNFNNFVSNNNGSSNKYKTWAVDGNYLKFSDES